jgi:hypothetical protein
VDRNVYQLVVRTPDGFQRDQEPGAAEKLVKYFPVEGLALYCILEPTVLATAGPSREAFSWAALGVAVLFCALYLHLVWRVTRTSHVLISCTALVLYVAALGGPFATWSFYAPGYAVAAAVAATALMVLVPSPPPPRRTHPGPAATPLDHPPVPHPRSRAGSDPHR